jgi:hypothetical protein
MGDKRDKQHMEAAQIRFLSSLQGYTKLDLKRNVDVGEQSKVQSIVEKNRIYQNWKERLEKKQDEKLSKLALKWQPVGKESKGRPKKGWKDQFLEES